MKKILTALLCALGFSLVSQADPRRINGTNFEAPGLHIGASPVGYADDGITADVDNWSWTNATMDGVAVIVTNDIKQYASECGFPAIHGGDANEKYLYLQTKGSPLVRSVKTDDQKIDETYGFYFDSLVQFTATDSLASKSNEDKLIVWLREQDGETNLVVTAGYLKGDYSAERKDYVVSNVDVESDKWYRLTIEAKTDIFKDNKSATFVVYVDGKRAEYSPDEAAFDSGTWTVDEKYSYLYTANCHAVFPSMVQSGDNKAKIASVAFEGVGRIDDIEFTTDAPRFTAAPASLKVTWTNGVDTLTITPSEGAPIEIAANGDAGSTNLEAGVYTVTATVLDGYMAATVTPDGEVDASSSVKTVEVTTSPVQATVDDTAYGSLEKAFEAAAAGDGKAVVSLVRDQAIVKAAGIEISGKNGFVLDLAGNTIEVTPDSNADGAINIGVPLTLIDSVGEGAITNTADNTTLYVINGGALNIGNADGDKGATVYGSISADSDELQISIVKGFFSEKPDSKYVAEGYKAEEGESLWEVVPADVPVENDVAKIGDQGYETFEGALSAAETNDTIVLLTNVVLSSTVTVDKNLTIDLNGNDIAATDCRAFHVKAGAFALTGSGTVSATASAEVRAMATPSFKTSSSVVRVGSDTATTSFTLGENVTVSSDWCYGVSYFGTKKQTVVIDGTVTVTGVQAALSGNGLAKYNTAEGGADVTVNGTVSATQDYAIYNPQTGTTVINGSVTGPGGIEVKAGSVTVNSGAVITATAQEQTHTASNDGTSTAGYAIAAVGSKSYQGEPAITVTGGTINGVAVVLADSADVENGTITATSNEISKPEGYKWVDATETPGSYTLKEIEYATVTIASVANCTITVKNGNDNVATGARFDVDDAVELTVTRVAAAGYKLAAGCLAEETVTMSENRTITAVVEEDKTDDWAVDTKDVEGKNASEAYGITGALAEVDAVKLTVWAKANNVAFAEASTILPEAYALNCANSAEAVATAKEAFEVQAITVDSEGNVTVTAPAGTFNGTLQMKGSTDLKTWTDTETTEGYNFFYYELNLK